MRINYSEDNELTNFREIRTGEIAKGVLYRGSCPFMDMESEMNRVYTKLALDAKIECVLNLADNESGVKDIAKSLPWYRGLWEKNKVIGLGIHFLFDFDYKKAYEIFKQRLKLMFLFMIKHKGPYLIHCKAGIDRTGFAAAIIEGLMGASIEEILYDYLLSNGRKFVGKKSCLNSNSAKIILNQLNTILKGKILDKENLQAHFERYFLNGIGLSRTELEVLKERLI